MEFMNGGARFIYERLPVRIEAIRPYFGWLVIVSEILAAVFIVVPRLRRIGVALAVGVHLMILLVIVGTRWNPSVWPWNVAIPFAAVAFFWSSQPSPARRQRKVALAIACLILLFPAGFYAGYVDAYMAHNLYTANTAWAVATCPHDPIFCSSDDFGQTSSHFRVALPPEPRLFRAYFDEVCSPGDTLIIHPRGTRVSFGRDTTIETHECPSRP